MTRLLENKWSLLISGVILLALVFTGLYFFLLYPLQGEIALKETELANDERLLATMQEKSVGANSISFESTTELQKKLPVKPLTDQFVRDLEKAEIVSNSEIQSMTFSESDVTIQAENDAGVTPNAEEEAVATANGNVKKVVASLSVKSPSYDELVLFLESILSMQRISTIDSLTFSGKEEITSIEQEVGELDYQLVVSTFYYPALTDLQDDIPVMEVPNPSGKDDPFSVGYGLKEDHE